MGVSPGWGGVGSSKNGGVGVTVSDGLLDDAIRNTKRANSSVVRSTSTALVPIQTSSTGIKTAVPVKTVSGGKAGVFSSIFNFGKSVVAGSISGTVLNPTAMGDGTLTGKGLGKPILPTSIAGNSLLDILIQGFNSTSSRLFEIEKAIILSKFTNSSSFPSEIQLKADYTELIRALDRISQILAGLELSVQVSPTFSPDFKPVFNANVSAPNVSVTPNINVSPTPIKIEAVATPTVTVKPEINIKPEVASILRIDDFLSNFISSILDIENKTFEIYKEKHDYEKTSKPIKDLNGKTVAEMSPREAATTKAAMDSKIQTDENDYEPEDFDFDFDAEILKSLFSPSSRLEEQLKFIKELSK